MIITAINIICNDDDEEVAYFHKNQEILNHHHQHHQFLEWKSTLCEIIVIIIVAPQ